MKHLFVLLILSIFILTPKTWASEEAFKIGATVSMSGPFSQEVGPFANLFKAWEKRVNKEGGIRVGSQNKRLEVFLYDDRSDQFTVRTAYERLIRSDKVDLLLGPYSSPLTFAASIPAEEMKRPFVAICGNSPKIYERNFKWLVGILDTATNYTLNYFDMLKTEKSLKTVAFVVEDSMHPRSVYQASRERSEMCGLKTIYEEIISSNTQDFSTTILKIKNLNPDLVFVASNVHFAVQFMKQAEEKQLSPLEYHCIHNSGIFKKALGGFAEKVVGQMYWVEGMKTNGSEDFINLIRDAKIDPYDFPWSVAYYAAFQTVLQALSNAKDTSSNGILKALKSTSYETVCGKNSFKENGIGQINPMPSQIQNGRYEIIWPPSLATGKHLLRR